LHAITTLKDFDYLTTLPKYVFGKYIALEVENSIKEQIKFKEYLDLLNIPYTEDHTLIAKHDYNTNTVWEIKNDD